MERNRDRVEELLLYIKSARDWEEGKACRKKIQTPPVRQGANTQYKIPLTYSHMMMHLPKPYILGRRQHNTQATTYSHMNDASTISIYFDETSNQVNLGC